jgi:hypothetical protein
MCSSVAASVVNGGAHFRHCHVPGLLGCDSAVFGSEPRGLRRSTKLLRFVPDLFARLQTLLALVPRFLGESPELFRVIPCRFGCDSTLFNYFALPFGTLTPDLQCLAQELGFPTLFENSGHRLASRRCFVCAREFISPARARRCTIGRERAPSRPPSRPTRERFRYNQ